MPDTVSSDSGSYAEVAEVLLGRVGDVPGSKSPCARIGLLSSDSGRAGRACRPLNDLPKTVQGHGNEDHPAWRLSVARPVKRSRLLYAHTRSPEPLIPTSPVVCGPFIRS